MYGLNKEECIYLFTQTKNEVERIYINYYQQQDDEQIQISYFKKNSIIGGIKLKEYIKWFLEGVLGKPYKDMSTIKLWQIEKKSVQKMELL